MRAWTLLLFGCLYVSTSVVRGQDTFSFILHDAETGAFVSAGGSCIDGDAIPGGAAAVSKVLPGVGVVHTQSYYHPANQALGTRLLRAGLSAKPVLDSLIADDVSLTPGFRQYIIATSDGQTALYTGTECAAWAGHRSGPGYAMAGNILLDSTILLRMQGALLAARARGASLIDQARATLRAAAVPGADKRCLDAGISCRSAFLRMALPGDNPDELAVDARVLYPQDGRDPIASLLERLDAGGAAPSPE